MFASGDRSSKRPSLRNYYVDEAGDGILFNRKGHVIVDSPGCSRYFILGLVDIPDPDAIGAELQTLREQLLADPYFTGVPSMQPDARKTGTWSSRGAGHPTPPSQIRTCGFSASGSSSG
jgi:hypothetical protein